MNFPFPPNAKVKALGYLNAPVMCIESYEGQQAEIAFCRWFTADGMLQEARFQASDLVECSPEGDLPSETSKTRQKKLPKDGWK
ncbi:MAG TPA: hypothetical protein PLB55_09385 [Prosthecobacter sp.]|jgi:hypothetical protein|nr:hypothetical protein [Prosthecobacter sp.]